MERLKRVRLVAMDVDGVLTDGGIILGTHGQEIKRFHVRDGHGMVLLHRVGIRTAIITGRHSQVVERRAQELGITFLFQGSMDKLATYGELKSQAGVQDEEVAYIGDDLVDIPIMMRVGVAVAVADAHPMVREVAHFVTKVPGGHGAVREFAEALLKAQGKWEEATRQYRG